MVSDRRVRHAILPGRRRPCATRRGHSCAKDLLRRAAPLPRRPTGIWGGGQPPGCATVCARRGRVMDGIGIGLPSDDRGAWCGRSVLVTGAGGFVASALCEALVELGASVIGIVRD